MNPRILVIVFGGALIGAAAFVAVTTSSMPDRVASHFGSEGHANGFMSRDAYLLVMMGVVVGIPLILVASIGLLPRAMPGLTNIPNRGHWLAPEHRAKTLSDLAAFGLVIGCVFIAFMSGVHGLVLQANGRTPPQLANGPFLAMLAAFFVALGLSIFAFFRRFRRPAERT